MPGNNRQVTVFMAPEGTETEEGEGMSFIDLDDYGTPLGVSDSILGGGEVIE